MDVKEKKQLILTVVGFLILVQSNLPCLSYEQRGLSLAGTEVSLYYTTAVGLLGAAVLPLLFIHPSFGCTNGLGMDDQNYTILMFFTCLVQW